MKLTTNLDKNTLELDKIELQQLLELVQVALTTSTLRESAKPAAVEIESLLRAGIEKKPSPATEELLSVKRTDQKEQVLLDNGYTIRYDTQLYLDKIRNAYTISKPLLDTE